MSGKAVSLPLMLAQQIGFGLACGAVAGRLAVWAMDRFSFRSEGNTIFAVAAMLVSYALPQVIGGNGYLAVYLCGIIMGNSRIPEKRNLMHVFDTVTGIAQMMILFFAWASGNTQRASGGFASGRSDYAVYDGDRTSGGCGSHSSAVPVPHPSDWRGVLGGTARCCLHCVCDHGCFSKVPMHYNLYNLVFCVVLLSIAVQGTFLPLVSEKLRMIDRNMDVRRTFNDYEEESSIPYIKDPYSGRASVL